MCLRVCSVSELQHKLVITRDGEVIDVHVIVLKEKL